MALKTDFKDEILQDGKSYRVYDIVNEEGGVVQADIHLVRKDTPQQVGSEYNAAQINELNNEVNGKQTRILYGTSTPDSETGTDNDVYVQLEG